VNTGNILVSKSQPTDDGELSWWAFGIARRRETIYPDPRELIIGIASLPRPSS